MEEKKNNKESLHKKDLWYITEQAKIHVIDVPKA